MAMTAEQQRALAIARARTKLSLGVPTHSQGTDPSNPMAANVPPQMPTGYQPSAFGQGYDRAAAFADSAVESIPFVGKPLAEAGAHVDAAFANNVFNPIARQFGADVPEHETPEQRRAITRSQQAEFPIESGAGVIAGNVGPLGGLAMTKVGQQVLGLSGAVLPRMALGGASGGIIAGGDTLIDTGDPMKAINETIRGFGVGALGGAVLPWLDNAAVELSRKAGIGPQTAATRLSRPSRDVLTRAAQTDDAFGPIGLNRMQSAGPTAMTADAGPALRSVLDTALQKAGPGSTRARDAIEARATEANRTVTQAMDRTLGSPQGVTAATTATRQGTAAARDDAYKAAYAQPIDYASAEGRTLERLLPRVPSGIMQLANRLMQLEGHQYRQILMRVADDGTVTLTRMPDVLQVDYITRALNTAAKSGEGQGALGGTTDIGRAFGNLARDLRTATRAAVPEYDVALRTAAQPIRQIEALRTGEGLLSPSMTRDAAREELAGLTGPELAAVRQGIRSRVDDVLANVRRVASDPNIDAREASKAVSDLTTRAAREKITMALDDPRQADLLFGQLEQAARALELRASVATNTRTYGRQAAEQTVNDAVQGGIFKAALRGEPLQAGRRATQAVTGQTPEAGRNLADRTWAEIAEALTRQGVDASRLLSDLAALASNPRAIAPYAPGAVQVGTDYVPPGQVPFLPLPRF